MVDVADGILVTLDDGLLDARRRSTLTTGEVEHLDAQLLQIVVLAHPIVAYDKDVHVDLLDQLGVVERTLRDDDIGILEGLDDSQTLLEGDDRRFLVRSHQLVGRDTHDKRIAQATGVFNHLQVVRMEHVESTTGINYDSIVVHNYYKEEAPIPCPSPDRRKGVVSYLG